MRLDPEASSRNKHLMPVNFETSKAYRFNPVHKDYTRLEVARGFMDLLNNIFPTRVAMRTWGLVVTMTLGLSGCSVLQPINSPLYYFWDSNPQTKPTHASVACTSPHALLTFNRLYASGTANWKKPPCSANLRFMHPMHHRIRPVKERDVRWGQSPHPARPIV
jgi:hypothetical protein